MRIVFMGTPAFAVPSLKALLDAGHEVAAVVTQPDRPRGRGQTLQLSPVKELALARNLRVEQPEKVRDPAFFEALRSIAPELIVVAAYGRILPAPVLDLPPRGAINVHGSLLPRHRGAAPIQRALLAGDSVTGITIMQMNERMDEGDILLRQETPIHPDDTTGSLLERLAGIGASALIDAIDRLTRGELHAIAQRESEATFAPMVQREEGRIDWNRGATEIERAIRAFQPWPTAYSTLGGKRIKLLRASVLPSASPDRAGTVLRATGDGIEIATGDGRLVALELQPEGKRRMTASELLRGRAIAEGDRFD